MSLREIATVLAQAPTLLQLAKEIKSRPLDTCDSFAARVERTTERFPNHSAVVFERCQPDHGKPYRIPGLPDRTQQAGLDSRVDQYEPEWSSADTLHQHHPVASVYFWRGVYGCNRHRTSGN